MPKKTEKTDGNEIPKAYDASLFENAIYRKWEDGGFFEAKIDKKKKPYAIIMPPPNATGQLHLGHAVMLALEDIMIRYHRMKGESVLWLPGTDHASIATQNKVEKLIAERGLTRHDLGREKFLEEIHHFVENSKSTIRTQIRKMGASCDWSRERYTFGKDMHLSVREIFTRMYKDGLIYRGDRIVNWCHRCSSTLSDDEVEYREERSNFYYIKYGPITIGTARPETKFADKVIIVHPDDERYKKYHGKKVKLPWINSEIEAIFLADYRADPEFGSGAMTITPAHSFVDFDIAQEHGLEVLQIIGQDGLMTQAAGEFAGMPVRECREALVKKMQSLGLIERIDENYVHNLSVCYRCSEPVEPLISKQWFIDVNKPFRNGKSLKDHMLEVVRNGEIKILPERFDKTYFHWIENLRDWCISRQIWFGHRIPVWYRVVNGTQEIHVGIEAPEGSGWEQDPDTLDTWFGVALWTFSTLGWPDETEELKYFHPTAVLETGYDILFFWVARMILMSTYALDEVPFKTVYLHGLVRTRDGSKMSKSKPETCIDPLDMIARYGADALRLSMVVGSSPGNDMRLYEEKIAGYRNFVNKIWNAARFALMNVSQEDLSKKFTKSSVKSTADRWILTRLQKIIKESTQAIEEYRFSEAGMKIYDFLWGELCDWYLEMSKGDHKNPVVLLYVLRVTLKLLHPFVPFVTEALWERVGQGSMLVEESWPEVSKGLVFAKEARELELLHYVIAEVRKLRADHGIPSSKKIHAVCYAGSHDKLFLEKKEVFMRMASLGELDIQKKGPKVPHSFQIFHKGVQLFFPMKELMDPKKELERVQKDLDGKKKALAALETLLSNKKFVQNAPDQVVAQEKEKKEILEQAVKQLADHRKELEKLL